LETNNLASVGVSDSAKLAGDDGSGELRHDMMPPDDRINEGFVDKSNRDFLPPAAESDAGDAVSQPHRTPMMPHASIIISKQSSSLRTFDLRYYYTD